MDLSKSVKKDILGCFSELVKGLSETVGKIYFDVDGNSLSHQNSIQKNSYEFLEKFFKKPFYSAYPLKMLLTTMDILEIKNGLIDLSDPKFHGKEYTSNEATHIHHENEKALVYLKTPFPPDLLSDAFEQKIKNVLLMVAEKDPATVNDIISDFLDNQKQKVNEVLMFCEILNLICISQCLYAFCYQLSQNSNFGRVIELIIRHGESNNPTYTEAFKLSERLYSVYIGNMSARVFSEQNLSLVEQALSFEGA